LTRFCEVISFLLLSQRAEPRNWCTTSLFLNLSGFIRQSFLFLVICKSSHHITFMLCRPSLPEAVDSFLLYILQNIRSNISGKSFSTLHWSFCSCCIEHTLALFC
jgi:hypothetical protein